MFRLKGNITFLGYFVESYETFLQGLFPFFQNRNATKI